jgi:hypothetical protein
LTGFLTKSSISSSGSASSFRRRKTACASSDIPACAPPNIAIPLCFGSSDSSDSPDDSDDFSPKLSFVSSLTGCDGGGGGF